MAIAMKTSPSPNWVSYENCLVQSKTLRDRRRCQPSRPNRQRECEDRIRCYSLLATASLLVAGFCTIRWALVDASMNTAGHIAEYERAYETASPAALIREFEEMEERGIELPVPYNYKRMELTKQAGGGTPWSLASSPSCL